MKELKKYIENIKTQKDWEAFLEESKFIFSHGDDNIGVGTMMEVEPGRMTKLDPTTNKLEIFNAEEELEKYDYLDIMVYDFTEKVYKWIKLETIYKRVLKGITDNSPTRLDRLAGLTDRIISDIKDMRKIANDHFGIDSENIKDGDLGKLTEIAALVNYIKNRI